MKLIKDFLKDQILNFIGYLCITFLILFYFYLKTGNPYDLIYPVILMLFVVFVITFIKGIHYYRFHHFITLCEYSKLNNYFVSNQEKFVMNTLQELHNSYQREISQMNHQRENSVAFIAQMAHDMKIPISVIHLLIEDCQSSSLSEEKINSIKKESDKLLDKLSQLLSYLRLGQFDKDFAIEQVDLVQEVRNAINKKKDYFILHKIYPQFHPASETVPILTDKKWHSFMLEQFISNGIKYSSVKGNDGYINFEIHNNQEFTELKITDYGIGIPPYDMQRIFEPFFTGENGRIVGNSSGIGLYLCRTIADKLGHQLSIQSVQGEKTEVTIRYLSKL